MKFWDCKRASAAILPASRCEAMLFRDHKVNISSDFCECSMMLSATINHLICPLLQAAKQTEGCYFSHTSLVLLMAELLTSKKFFRGCSVLFHVNQQANKVFHVFIWSCPQYTHSPFSWKTEQERSHWELLQWFFFFLFHDYDLPDDTLFA